MDKRKRLLLKFTILILVVVQLVIGFQFVKKIKKELAIKVSVSGEDADSSEDNKVIFLEGISNVNDEENKLKIFKSISKLFRRDKIPPILNLKPVTIYSYESIVIEDFVEKVLDDSVCTVYYKVPPNLDIVGEQEVTIEARDSSDNITIEKTILTIKKDTTPPVISGCLDKFIYLGDTISYKEGVTAIDDIDGALDINVDNSKVDLKQVGVYEVIYTARDKSGNTSSVTVNLNVIEKPEGAVDIEEVDRIADEVLERIITSDMSKVEQARKIFYWVKSNVSYSKHSSKESWVTGAYEGFKYRKGDCFIYFSTAKALLTRAGIENIDVVEINGRHYWNMINCGGGWYHFDTTVFLEAVDVFMWTDVQVDNLYITGYKLHTWDRETVPASVE